MSDQPDFETRKETAAAWFKSLRDQICGEFEALERDAPGTPEFAKILRETVPYADRLGLAMAMWQVLLADGEQVPIEEDTLHQIEAAMGITPDDSADIKTRALGS